MLLVDRVQMRKIDQTMIDEIGVESTALMELAGAAVAKTCLRYLQEQIGKEFGLIHIVAGKGHNGADGLVAARHLLSASQKVLVWLAEPESQLSQLGQKQLHSYLALGGELACSDDDLAQADLIVDALLGTGSRLPLSDSLRPLVKAATVSGRPVIALDIPSGLDADTGQVDPDTVTAVLTVTMGFAKFGLFQYPGQRMAGSVVVEQLSMPDELAVRLGAYGQLLTESLLKGWHRQRLEDSHKGSFGKVGVVAGSKGMLGAARLSLQAAYRGGAGLVEYFAAADLPEAFIATLPSEVLVHRYAGRSEHWEQTDLAELVTWSTVQSVLVMGPGIGKGLYDVARAQQELFVRIAEIPRPLLLDADFLNLLALLPDQGKQWLAQRTDATILTPHPKEFARLLQLDVTDVQQNRIQLARNYAVSQKVIVVLKGAGTVIATPDGTVYINTSGNHGLATGGSGDVLAGFIGGLVAAGYEAAQATMLGVYLHGKAADLAVKAGASEEALMAGDLFPWLSKAFAQFSHSGK